MSFAPPKRLQHSVLMSLYTIELRACPMGCEVVLSENDTSREVERAVGASDIGALDRLRCKLTKRFVVDNVEAIELVEQRRAELMHSIRTGRA